MTARDFRTLALELPGALEGAHMGHPDFRVGGKIFATLGPDEAYGVAMLTPDLQADLVAAAPAVFSPVPGGWGERGSTRIELKPARRPEVRRALHEAWRLRAPKTLLPGGKP